MNTNSLTVVLNISRRSVPEKISYGWARMDAIAANPNIFPNPVPTLAELGSGLDDLQIAYTEAAEGGKIKTAIMHDKEKHLVKMLTNLAHYVELIADGDEEKVHLTGFDIKRPGVPHRPLFSIGNAADKGAVLLRVKAQAKTLYYWQLNPNPEVLNGWQTAKTTGTCSTTIGDLESGKTYSFRVMFATPSGESYSEIKSWVVE